MNFRSKRKTAFKFHRDYTDTQNRPCVKHSCPGFMFKTLVCYESHGDVFEEWECFTCKRTRKVGLFKKGNEPFSKENKDGKQSRYLSKKGRQNQGRGKGRDRKQEK